MLGKQISEKEYRWGDAIMGSTFPNYYLETELEAGTYIVYVKHDWVKAQTGESTFSLYFENNAVLEEASEHAEFLHKVYLDYAIHSKESKQALGSGDEWLFVKLMYEKGGFGVIAARAESSRLRISGPEHDFNQNGFVLKKPHKGSKTVEEVVKPY